MYIKTLGSTSKGNCYIISDGTTKLMLECGIKLNTVLQKLNYNLHGIAACLLSHEHKDHSIAVQDILYRGIPIYTSQGTIDALSVNSDLTYLLNPVKHNKTYKINTFYITPFNTIHDSAEPLGFLIKSSVTGKKLVFITDTNYCNYKFPDLTHIMIECNYIDELLKSQTPSDTLFIRVLHSHMGLNACLNFLRNNDLSKVEQIILIHLSDERSNKTKMLDAVKRTTGKYTIIAGE